MAQMSYSKTEFQKKVPGNISIGYINDFNVLARVVLMAVSMRNFRTTESSNLIKKGYQRNLFMKPNLKNVFPV